MNQEGNSSEPRRLPDILFQRKRRKLPGGSYPTFSGALEWLRRHKDELDTALRLVSMYPNLIQDKSADSLWDFLSPLVSRNRHDTDGVCTTQNTLTIPDMHDQFTHGSDDGFSVLRQVVLCHNDLEDHSRLKQHLDSVIHALLPCFAVRCFAPETVNIVPKQDIIENVMYCNAFIFIMNDFTIDNAFCLQLLDIAVANNVPIVSIREPGFKVPSPPSEISSQRDLVNGKPVEKFPARRVIREFRRTQSDDSLISGRNSPLLNSLQYVDIELLVEAYHEALVYTTNFHDVCIAKLYNKLSLCCGTDILIPSMSELEYPTGGKHEKTSREASRNGVEIPQTEKTASSPVPRYDFEKKRPIHLPPIKVTVNSPANGVTQNKKQNGESRARSTSPRRYSDGLGVDDFSPPLTPNGKKTTYLVFPPKGIESKGKPYLMNWPPPLFEDNPDSPHSDDGRDSPGIIELSDINRGLELRPMSPEAEDTAT